MKNTYQNFRQGVEHSKMLRERSMLQSLITLGLFFLRTVKAECPVPRVLEYSVILSSEAVLRNEFPEGSLITLECDNGYVAQEGSHTITCLSGNWTEVKLRCTRKDCGPPKVIPHLTFLYQNGKNATYFTDRITAVCEQGFQLVGSSFWQCLNHGWKGRSICEGQRFQHPSKTPMKEQNESSVSESTGTIIAVFGAVFGIGLCVILCLCYKDKNKGLTSPHNEAVTSYLLGAMSASHDAIAYLLRDSRLCRSFRYKQPCIASGSCEEFSLESIEKKKGRFVHGDYFSCIRCVVFIAYTVHRAVLIVFIDCSSAAGSETDSEQGNAPQTSSKRTEFRQNAASYDTYCSEATNSHFTVL
ncbi:uncharacterized protein LOC125286202 isoform X4 [Alosa alosa]|uniref:uncharacterized protein LOC125286202 isoform X4 n=1 Tax=Alosa alosa TaxID=278164 RepID=UPI00201519FD|nr:uncharacterized protein LOC125286202 isoform X4 [Alosa alosa]